MIEYFEEEPEENFYESQGQAAIDAEMFNGRLCCRIAYLEGQIDQTRREMDKLNAKIDKEKSDYWARQQALADEFMAEMAAKEHDATKN